MLGLCLARRESLPKGVIGGSQSWRGLMTASYSRRQFVSGSARVAAAGAAVSALAGWAAAPGTASAAELPDSWHRRVPVGGGREIWLESGGRGGPVVVLESGYHDGASIWTVNPGSDLLVPAVGPAVFPGLAATNQVIAYYRPGTLDYTTSSPQINTKSSPAPMHRTAADVVTDLHWPAPGCRRRMSWSRTRLAGCSPGCTPRPIPARSPG
jgi:hypothetical protein